MPILPLINAQGQDWRFIIAEKIEVGSIVIWMEEALDGTQKVSDISPLMAIIRRLARWTNEDYGVWLERNVFM